MDEFRKSPTNNDQAPADAELPPVSGDSTTSGVFFASDETALFRPSAEFQKAQKQIASPLRRIANRYTVRREIGSGGFGRVLEAHDEVLDRIVAIKVARKTRAINSPESQEFQAEARLAAKITHPNVVTVYDWGVESGQCFVVFEYVSGRTLADRIKEGNIGRIQAIRWMIDIAQAVHAAHKLELVHRDLKPANILLDEAERPRVADFGLAMTAESREAKAGEIAGSPPYMAPEQLRGQTENFDARTDVWGLGVILFELLTKRRPFVADNKDHVGLVHQILNRTTPHLCDLDPSIPAEIDAICHRCLAKEINDRWETADALAKALEQALLTIGSQVAVASLSTTAPSRPTRKVLTWIVAIAAISGVIWKLRGKDETPGVSAPQTQVAVDNQPDTASRQVKPQVPVPGEWFPLLTREPEQLLWPEDLAKSRWTFLPERNELWMQCSGHGLLKIGESHRDYDLKIEIAQATWAGWLGIFFGMQDDVLAGFPAYRCEVITVRGQTPRNGQFGATLERSIFKSTIGVEPARTLGTKFVNTPPAAPWSTNKPEDSSEVRQTFFGSVEWRRKVRITHVPTGRTAASE